MVRDIYEILDMLKKECDKLVEYYETILDNPDFGGAEANKLITSIENYIDQLPPGVQETVRELLAQHMSQHVAVGFCYSIFGNTNRTAEILTLKLLQDSEDAEFDNELVIDSYNEFMQSLFSYVYYTYSFHGHIDMNSLICVAINNFDVISYSKNRYYLDDITTDLDEFVRFIYDDSMDYYNELNPHTPLTVSADDGWLIQKTWTSLSQTFNQSIRDLLSIEGFILTENNRTSVCDYIYYNLIHAFYLNMFGIDINNFNLLDEVMEARTKIFKYPGHINPTNFIDELKLAALPHIDLFVRLVFKITYEVNQGLIEYTDKEKAEALLRLKRGFEYEIYYNSSNLRTNQVARRIPSRQVQRDYSGAKQYLHTSQSR